MIYLKLNIFLESGTFKMEAIKNPQVNIYLYFLVDFRGDLRVFSLDVLNKSVE